MSLLRAKVPQVPLMVLMRASSRFLLWASLEVTLQVV